MYHCNAEVTPDTKVYTPLVDGNGTRLTTADVWSPQQGCRLDGKQETIIILRQAGHARDYGQLIGTTQSTTTLIAGTQPTTVNDKNVYRHKTYVNREIKEQFQSHFGM